MKRDMHAHALCMHTKKGTVGLIIQPKMGHQNLAYCRGGPFACMHGWKGNLVQDHANGAWASDPGPKFGL